ncbi:unnamed protein product [Soboliphyme baturini]|uniref:PA domain-containing protein n=1 Tax=Soboliphyme baturini TaxID=241478 RepID=A0A183IHB4_9BILA|nr:unnamed protein product [Soboliphyme baturini]
MVSSPFYGYVGFDASPAHFGMDLTNLFFGVIGKVAIATPFRACCALKNDLLFAGKVVVVERGDCTFLEKTQNVEKAGGIAAIVLDSDPYTSMTNSSFFVMSADGNSTVRIPSVFLFGLEAKSFMKLLADHPDVLVRLGEKTLNPSVIISGYWRDGFRADHSRVLSRKVH